ncbi:MAG: DMT family transporter [Clostridia bacterium]|nr:DMT family transporter [Clostridia bacterium]
MKKINSSGKHSIVKGELTVFLAAALWSLSAILSKQLSINPVLMNGLRCVFALAFTLPFLRFKLKINKQIAIGAICFAVTNIAYFIALKMTTAANAVVLQYTAPILVLLEMWIFKKKRPSLIQFTVVAIAFIGIVCIFMQDILKGGGSLIGNAFALLAGLAFSGVFYINKQEGASTLDATCFGYIISIIVGAFFINGIVDVDVRGWLVLAVMGFFQIGLAYVLFASGIKYCSEFSSSLIATVEVVLLPLWVAIFANELPDTVSIVGAVLILGAVIVNIMYENKRRKVDVTIE